MPGAPAIIAQCALRGEARRGAGGGGPVPRRPSVLAVRGAVAGAAVSDFTGALTTTADSRPSLSLNVSVTGTASPSLSGAFSAISITW